MGLLLNWTKSVESRTKSSAGCSANLHYFVTVIPVGTRGSVGFSEREEFI